MKRINEWSVKREGRTLCMSEWRTLCISECVNFAIKLKIAFANNTSPARASYLSANQYCGHRLQMASPDECVISPVCDFHFSSTHEEICRQLFAEICRKRSHLVWQQGDEESKSTCFLWLQSAFGHPLVLSSVGSWCVCTFFMGFFSPARIQSAHFSFQFRLASRVNGIILAHQLV